MSQLKPEQQRLLKQRLRDNPVFAAQFNAFHDSGDLDRAAKHLCIAYQLFTLANARQNMNTPTDAQTNPQT